ncbi:MAG: DUF4328 domain-containing protein [Bacteroidales bacterium]|jgi:hypothetical protein|nr:DUF4328 domain-containing protein [Bacteroidales bacterium]
MNTLRPNADRAKNAIILIIMVLSIQVIEFFINIINYNLYSRIAEEGVYTMAETVNSDFLVAVISLLLFTVYITSTVVFLMWFRRAYYNLKHLGMRRAHDDGWAVAAWFVPIMNLFRPYQIMRELYETSDLYIKARDENHKPNDFIFVGWWWALWIISIIYSRVSTKVYLKAETAEDYMNSATIDIIGIIVSVPLALCTIKVIKDYKKIEDKITEIYNNPPELD